MRDRRTRRHLDEYSKKLLHILLMCYNTGNAFIAFGVWLSVIRLREIGERFVLFKYGKDDSSKP